MIVHNQAVISLTPTADHSSLEGYFVTASAGSAALVTAATDIPLGVILDGEPTTGRDTIALNDGFSGIVTVKVTGTSPGTIALGTYLTLKSDGTVQADAGTGARVQVARAMQSGAASELIHAVLIKPTSIAA